MAEPTTSNKTRQSPKTDSITTLEKCADMLSLIYGAGAAALSIEPRTRRGKPGYRITLTLGAVGFDAEPPNMMPSIDDDGAVKFDGPSLSEAIDKLHDHLLEEGRELAEKLAEHTG